MLKPHSLITGVNGFAGKHLATLLLKHGWNVYGIDLQEKYMAQNVTYFQVNVCDHESVRRICDQVKPLGIYHLAGVAYPAGFHLTPYNSFQMNIMGTISVLDTMRTESNSAVLLLVALRRNIRPLIFITRSRKKAPWIRPVFMVFQNMPRR